MSLGRLLHGVKPILRPVYSPLKRAWKGLRPARSADQLHAYWKSPPDALNKPTAYVHGHTRSLFLVGLISKRVPTHARVLEIGTNVGRNLNCLHQAGYRRLEGIEINASAVELFRETFRDAATCATMHVDAMERVLPGLQTESFDLVYSMAVLEHLHPSQDELVFSNVARVTKQYLVTIENEAETSWKAFHRNYRVIFESLGLRQIEEHSCAGVEGLSWKYVARIFAKR